MDDMELRWKSKHLETPPTALETKKGKDIQFSRNKLENEIFKLQINKNTERYFGWRFNGRKVDGFQV